MWAGLMVILPLLVKVITMILDKNGADATEKQAVLDLIAKSSDDPLESIKMKDDFNELRAKLKARLNKDNV